MGLANVIPNAHYTYSEKYGLGVLHVHIYSSLASREVTIKLLTIVFELISVDRDDRVHLSDRKVKQATFLVVPKNGVRNVVLSISI